MSKSTFKPNSTVEYEQFNVTANTEEIPQNYTKMYYKLTPIPSRDAHGVIKNHIDKVAEECKPNAEFMTSLGHKLDNNDVIFQGFLIAPPDDICKQVIGRNGCYFYQTTAKNDIAMIWHDRERKKFLFWGAKFNIIKSMNIIKHRIDKISNKETIIT